MLLAIDDGIWVVCFRVVGPAKMHTLPRTDLGIEKDVCHLAQSVYLVRATRRAEHNEAAPPSAASTRRGGTFQIISESRHRPDPRKKFSWDQNFTKILREWRVQKFCEGALSNHKNFART